MNKELKEKLEKREITKYHVDFEVTSDIINASIKLKESISENEVYCVCYPNLTKVLEMKIDGIEYEVQGNGEDLKIYEINTGKRVRKQAEIEYLQKVANYIIEKGNKYLINTFGNIDKKIIKL